MKLLRKLEKEGKTEEHLKAGLSGWFNKRSWERAAGEVGGKPGEYIVITVK